MKYRLGCSLEEYQRKIESGEWQAHTFPKGFVVTQIIDYEEEKVLTVHLLGGKDFDEWKEEANQRLIAFGREHGCKSLEAACRFGLGRKLKRLGWKPWHVVMKKDLQ